jgi:hypothetical protein
MPYPKITDRRLVSIMLTQPANVQCVINNGNTAISKYIVKITNAKHRFSPLLYSISWLLHVLAVVLSWFRWMEPQHSVTQAT